MRIRALTGIRSDYDLMQPIFQALHTDKDFDFGLIVAGAHLSHHHGETLSIIEEDNFRISYKIHSLFSSDKPEGRVKGLGIQLASLVDYLANERPDCLIILGDREEAMVGALAGAYMNIPVAHFAGGDRVVGNVDDQVRHAVSSLAHLHFVFSDEASNRLKKMGEQPHRIFNIGNPGIERLISTPFVFPETLLSELNLKPNNVFCMVLQHTISSELENSEEQMEETLAALSNLGHKAIIVRPNSDSGSAGINKTINKWIKINKNFKSFHNIPRVQFVNLLRNVDYLIGNSSMGILEAPALELPVINVGNRQKGRLHSENVVFVEHNRDKIKDAVQFALEDHEYRKKLKSLSQHYGKGDSSKRFTRIIKSVLLDKNLLMKDITY